MPKVSVIVPVYNADAYVGKCIESVQTQTMDDWELILVNDASTDKSLQIIKEYEVKDERIKVLSYDENKGPMYARERGCKIASGDYITFCDSDDQLAANALQLMYSTALEQSVDVVVCQLMNLFPDGKTSPYFIEAQLKYGNSKESFFKSILLREIHQGVAGKLFRNQIVKDGNIIVYEHCTIGEDATVLFQYIDRCKSAKVLKESLYFYVQNQNSSTHSRMSSLTLEGVLKTTRLRINILSKYPNLKKDMNNYFIGNLIGLFPIYNINGEFYSLIEKYDLADLVKRWNIFRYCSFKRAIYYMALRDIYPFVNKILSFVGRFCVLKMNPMK